MSNFDELYNEEKLCTMILGILELYVDQLGQNATIGEVVKDLKRAKIQIQNEIKEH